jgi:hypothetical protein
MTKLETQRQAWLKGFNAAAQGKWIKISENIPVTDKALICSHSRDGVQHVGCGFYRDGKFWDSLDNEIFLDDGQWKITHWMPLPNEPTGDCPRCGKKNVDVHTCTPK